MNRAPFTQAKTFDHEDVELEFTDTLVVVDVFVDLGMAALLFSVMAIVVFALVAARDSDWLTWLVLWRGGL